MILQPSRALIALDCENLSHSAKGEYGPHARIDYRKLLDLMQLRIDQEITQRYHVAVEHVEKLAFTSVKPGQYTQLDFLCYLGYRGFTVKTSVGVLANGMLHRRPDYAEWMSEEIRKLYMVPQVPAIVCMGCGSSRLRKLYYELQSYGVIIELFGIQGSISAHIEDVTRHPLNDSFLLA